MLRSSLAALKGWNSSFLLIPQPPPCRRCFRSEPALDALRSHSRTVTAASSGDAAAARSHLVLYNYPSFSGAFAALFAHIFHSHLGLPFLVLPFSSVEPFRAEDFETGAFETCYLLDFIGPKLFSVELSRILPRVIAFDHRENTLRRISRIGDCLDNLELRIDTKKSSARAVYDFFSEKLFQMKSSQGEIANLLNKEDEERVATVLRHVEDVDLHQWRMPYIKAFNIGLRDERAKLNCITNPFIFEQLLQIDASFLIAKGNSYTRSREDAAKKLLEKAFKIQLGRGLYGECLVSLRTLTLSKSRIGGSLVHWAVRADGNSDLSHEIGVELSRRSAAAGLTPIGAVVFMQRRNLKMCLRSTDCGTDTSEIAKAFGGGGNRSSSSFIIRMDEYNHWSSAN